MPFGLIAARTPGKFLLEFAWGCNEHLAEDPLKNMKVCLSIRWWCLDTGKMAWNMAGSSYKKYLNPSGIWPISGKFYENVVSNSVSAVTSPKLCPISGKCRDSTLGFCPNSGRCSIQNWGVSSRPFSCHVQSLESARFYHWKLSYH